LASDVSPARLAWLTSPQPAASSKPAQLDPDASARPIATSTASDVIQTGGTREASPRTPLPAPDATGTIQLKPGVEYAPSKIAVPGRLTIRGPEDRLARIVMTEGRWELQADLVRFENVAIDLAGDRSELSVECRGLELARCDVSQPDHALSTGCIWRP